MPLRGPNDPLRTFKRAGPEVCLVGGSGPMSGGHYTSRLGYISDWTSGLRDCPGCRGGRPPSRSRRHIVLVRVLPEAVRLWLRLGRRAIRPRACHHPPRRRTASWTWLAGRSRPGACGDNVVFTVPRAMARADRREPTGRVGIEFRATCQVLDIFAPRSPLLDNLTAAPRPPP